MEELAEGTLKGILGLVAFVVRFLIWLIWDSLFEIVAWYVGWPICRTISLGKLPIETITEHDMASNLTRFIVFVVGFSSLLGAALLLSKLVGSA